MSFATAFVFVENHADVEAEKLESRLRPIDPCQLKKAKNFEISENVKIFEIIRCYIGKQ